MNGRFVGDGTTNAIESAKAAAIATVADFADNEITTDDLLSVLNEMSDSDEIAESLFAHAG